MTQVYIAMLGSMPGVVTVGLDLLIQRMGRKVDEVVVASTDPSNPRIAKALTVVKDVLEGEQAKQYAHLNYRVRYHTLTDRNGQVIYDTIDQMGVDAYFGAISKLLREYKMQNAIIDYMVSGGRAAMIGTAILAAAPLFDAHDYLWTLVSKTRRTKDLEDEVRLPKGPLADDVQLLRFPLVTLANVAQMVEESPFSLQAKRDHFINQILTPKEREVVDAMLNNPTGFQKDWAAMLNKGVRTVESQIQSIYDKMDTHFPHWAQVSDKRRALLDFLQGAG